VFSPIAREDNQELASVDELALFLHHGAIGSLVVPAARRGRNRMLNWKDYRTLWRLARQRFRSGQDYQAFQIFQASLLMAYFRSCGLTFQGKQVLDMGCGSGGYSQFFAQAGARVVSLDIEVHRALVAEVRHRLVLGNAQTLPFADRQFDFIFCASLIEHVPDPGRLLAESYRVLHRGGRCYVGFPPFYSPSGGHQFKPFHLLGERTAVALAGKGTRNYASAGGSWGLQRLTIRQARHYLIQAGFVIDETSTKFLPVNLAPVPWLGEVLTWYVQFVARKADE
jgi:SAM-dependent methyltransferase